MLYAVLAERDREKQRAEDFYLQNLRLQMKLARYKKWTYGPRADRLSASELAQMLLKFAEELEQKPIHSDDLALAEPEPELRRCESPGSLGAGSVTCTSKNFAAALSRSRFFHTKKYGRHKVVLNPRVD